MIVVINPSGAAGHSFKGLHAYCAHDAGNAQTTERVDWMETRNLATDDAHVGWKIMAATALALLAPWAFGWHLVWQLGRLDIDDPDICLELFRRNRDTGLIPVLFFAGALLL